MSSLGRIWIGLGSAWRRATPRQRWLTAAMGLAATGAVALLLAANHRGTEDRSRSPVAPAPSAGAAPSQSSLPSETRSATALPFMPYSSLQTAATRDVEQRLRETISSLTDIARAHVIVRPAQDERFDETPSPASALVILGVREGGRITADVIEAIAEAATASGASPEHVRVMSEEGTTLFRNGTALVTQIAASGTAEDALASPAHVDRPAREPEERLALMGCTAGGALLLGFVGGMALRGRHRTAGTGEELGGGGGAAADDQSLVVAPGRVMLMGLTVDDLLAVVACERASVAARLLESIDMQTAATVLGMVPERQRAEIADVRQSATRPWRRAAAALRRAATMSEPGILPHATARGGQRTGGDADGTCD